MNTIDSAVNSKSQEFIENSEVMQGLVDDLQAQVARVMQGGGERYQQRHQARGKLLVRDRIDALIDTGSPFLEFSQLAGLDCTVRMRYRRRAWSLGSGGLRVRNA